MLGAGVYRAFIQTRGGGDQLAELTWGSLSFGRRLDDVSEASVAVPAGSISGRCCSVLEIVRAWQHELAIWRDDDEVWVGVVGKPKYTGAGVVLPARDLFQWFARRLLPFDRSYIDTDLGEIFAQYVEDALSRDTSPNITVETVSATGVSGSRQVLASQYRRADDELRELARSGIDWTMVGRTLRVGGEEVPTGELLMLTTDSFDDPEIEPDGLETATEVTVVGSRSDDPDVPIVGVYGGPDGDLGLVQIVEQESSIEDDASAEAAARTRWEMLHEVPEYVRGALSPFAPVSFDQLVPGARVELRVRAGCHSAIGAARLQALAVDAQVGPEGEVTAKVVPTFIPLGTVESAA